MSVRWYVACWDCERKSFVDKIGNIYDAQGARIWGEYPPYPLDAAELVLFVKAHGKHRIGLYADNADPFLGEMLDWKGEQFVPYSVYIEKNKRDKTGIYSK